MTATAVALLIQPAAARAHTIDHARSAPAPEATLGSLTGVPTNRLVVPAALRTALAAKRRMVPSFSRQTGLACSFCHYQFPQLTPFGRMFKLNGYTLSNQPAVEQPGDSAGRESLKLATIPPVAVMLVSSLTHTATTQPGTQNGTTAFPQQFSIFAAGALAPHAGAFTQFTYTARDGSFGIDNFDIRYANHLTLGSRDLIYGLTLHNNPTVQDVWNTVPAWSFPFMSSASAPTPIASTLISGGLGQQVIGLGAYSLYDKVLYTEFTAYRSSRQGAAAPLDSTARNVAARTIPYWRVALQRESKTTSLMLGTFGLNAYLYPEGVSGPRDHYTDVAVDAQIEQRHGAAVWIGRASFIHERQQLVATQLAGGAADVDHTLWTTQASLAYLPSMRHSITIGYFQTNGGSDTTLYAPAVFVGSQAGRPNSSGVIGELGYNPWQNLRLALEYVAYTKFNGSTTAYDVAGGRNASDNNTLYLYLWTAF